MSSSNLPSVLTIPPHQNFRDSVAIIRRYTGGGTVVVDENTGTMTATFLCGSVASLWPGHFDVRSSDSRP